MVCAGYKDVLARATGNTQQAQSLRIQDQGHGGRNQTAVLIGLLSQPVSRKHFSRPFVAVPATAELAGRENLQGFLSRSPVPRTDDLRRLMMCWSEPAEILTQAQSLRI
ncbi:hypothetical protein MRX96_010981 [Rhipicephalus microplus]